MPGAKSEVRASDRPFPSLHGRHIPLCADNETFTTRCCSKTGALRRERGVYYPFFFFFLEFEFEFGVCNELQIVWKRTTAPGFATVDVACMSF